MSLKRALEEIAGALETAVVPFPNDSMSAAQVSAITEAGIDPSACSAADVQLERIASRSWTTVRSVISQNVNIRKLNFQRCMQTNLSDLVVSADAKLDSLCWRDCEFSPNPGMFRFQATWLRHFELTNCDLGDLHIAQLLSWLRGNAPSISELILRQVGARRLAMDEFCQPGFNQLELLDVGGNAFTPSLISRLCSELRAKPALRHFGLAHSSLDYFSVSTIAQFVRASTVAVVDIRHCNLSSASTLLFQKAIEARSGEVVVHVYRNSNSTCRRWSRVLQFLLSMNDGAL